MSLAAKEAAVVALREADAEAGALRLKRLEKEFELMHTAVPWICEGLAAAPEKLVCLREMDAINEIYRKCCRIARRRGFHPAARDLEKEDEDEGEGEGEEDFEHPLGEMDCSEWFSGFAKGLLPLLKHLLHLMQDNEEDERCNFLMPHFSKSTQRLRRLYLKSLENGDLSKQEAPASKRPGKAIVEEGDEAGEVVAEEGKAPRKKRRVAEAAPKGREISPLKAVMTKFAAGADYKAYVVKYFSKGSFPFWVQQMKKNDEVDLSPKADLEAACKDFLAALKNVVEELRGLGYDERSLKERADEWWFDRLQSFEVPQFPVVHCLQVLTKMMADEPRLDKAVKKSVEVVQIE